MFSRSRCNDHLTLREYNFFVIIGIENQLKGIIKKYWPQIFAYMNESALRNCDSLKDIADGDVLKTLNERNKKTYNLSLLMNTDGANVFESNQISLWPVQFYFNFLPPSLRFQLSNIVVGALFVGEKKPDVLKFFEPLGKELERLQESLLTVEIEKMNWQFSVSLTHTSLDLPAKAMVQNKCQYNGRIACSYCLHPGQSVKNPRNGRKTIKYTWRERPYKLRENLDLLKTMQQMDNLSKVKEHIYFGHFYHCMNILQQIHAVTCNIQHFFISIISSKTPN